MNKNKMNKITKKTIIAGIMMGTFICYAIAGVAAAGFTKNYAEVVENQSKYTISVAKSRGIIYDCSGKPLTNTSNKILAVCMPTQKAFAVLEKNYVGKLDAEALIKEGKPFTVEVSMAIECEDINYFTISKRYSENQLCQSLIGYVDGSGNGVCGIEKAMNGTLSENNGEISLTYTSDAAGRAIIGGTKEISDTYTETESGIALTIDSTIQAMAEKAAEKIKSGAVVVMSVKDAKIRAIVSKPGYNANLLDEALAADDSPLVDRSLSAFSPGSVFKLVLAEAALNNGMDYRENYNCTGSTTTDGLTFTCYGGKKHGEVNLHTALQKSCNCYFINLSKRIPIQSMLETALNLGLGTETKICDNLSGASGTIPDASALENSRALSNFAIGQGDVAVTPVQMAGLVGAIANEGIYTVPTVYEGDVNEEGKITGQNENTGGVSVMEASVALRLRNYMQSVVKYGTGMDAYSDDYVAGAKTGTAETGVYENGKQLLNYWYCGFVGRTQQPEYVIIAMSDRTQEGENMTAETFAEIAAKLTADT